MVAGITAIKSGIAATFITRAHKPNHARSLGMYTLTSLYIYPVKSLGGIAVEEAIVQPRGLQYDRRWMLIDAEGRFMSQREAAELALLGTAIDPPYLRVFTKKNPAVRIQIPLEPPLLDMPEIDVQIWDDRCTARLHDPAINAWFSRLLGTSLRLVYMPDSSQRATDPQYAAGQLVSFADGYPFLLIGQASLDELNRRLAEPLPMDRFRPNFVFEGGVAHEEDHWREFSLGDQPFCGVKPCARCVIPTTDQETAMRSPEPTRTLATYRRNGHKILFGQNVVWLGTGSNARVRTGDRLSLKNSSYP